MFDGDYPFVDKFDSTRLGECHSAWLERLCRCVPQAVSATLVLCDGTALDSYHQPNSILSAEILESLIAKVPAEAVQFASVELDAKQHAAIVCALPAKHLEQIQALSNSSPLKGAVIVTFSLLDKAQLTALARLIQKNFDWHTLLLQYAEQTKSHQFLASSPQTLDDSLSRLLEKHSAIECAQAITHLFAERLDCDRVTACLLQANGRASLLSVSGVVNPDPKQSCNAATLALFARLGDSQDDVHSPTTHPEYEAAFATYLQAANTAHCTAVLLPTAAGNRIGFVFESTASQAQMEARVRHQLALLIRPASDILGLKLQASAGPLTRFNQLLTAHLRELLGGRNLRAKITLMVLCLLCAAALIVPLDFKIAAPVELTGTSQRAIAAPFDGHIASAHVEAGMSIDEGQVLVELDSRKLTLELEKWQSEKSKLNREYDQALAQLKQADAQIIRAQIGQAEAELNLVRRQIEQSRLVAPFAGVVIAGDLRRSIGAPVDQGEVLFEIAPLDNYQVVLSVDERDIYYVETAQTGAVVLNALPNERWAFETTTVASALPTEDGRRAFRVEAKLLEPSTQLRPGMEGLGKISIGQASAAYIFTRRFLAWLQINLWARLP